MGARPRPSVAPHALKPRQEHVMLAAAGFFPASTSVRTYACASAAGIRSACMRTRAAANTSDLRMRLRLRDDCSPAAGRHKLAQRTTSSSSRGQVENPAAGAIRSLPQASTEAAVLGPWLLLDGSQNAARYAAEEPELKVNCWFWLQLKTSSGCSSGPDQRPDSAAGTKF